jgi:hypothetical protein
MTKKKKIDMSAQGGMFNAAGFIKSIISGYKAKFHWPVKRDVYHTEITIGHIVFLIALLLTVGLTVYINNTRLHPPQKKR